MRLILLCILFSFASCNAWHSFHSNKEVFIDIRTSCGFSGQTSVEFDSVRGFLIAKDDTALLALASEKTIGNNIRFQLLSIIAIDNILTTRQIKMTLIQEEEIIAFKKRMDKVLVCSSCDLSPFTTIHDLFKTPDNPYRTAINAALGQKKQ